MTVVISTENLVKFYGKRRGLDGLDMTVERGEIYGFLGPNGAGKTTTIRLLLDVIRPTSGNAQVLGLDPRQEGVELRKRIGYLPGDFKVNPKQTGRQLLDYVAGVRGNVPAKNIDALAERFDLDLSVQIGNLSKGNRQKVGVVQAFMHEPELLILDEPTSGLDPLLQREFQAMVRELVGNGQTVFMSSHVLSEVQAVADRVGIIREGRMVAVERVEDLREKAVRRVTVVFDEHVPAATFESVEGMLDIKVEEATLTCHLEGRADPFVKAIARFPVSSIISEEPDLEELFFDYYAKEGPGE